MSSLLGSLMSFCGWGLQKPKSKHKYCAAFYENKKRNFSRIKKAQRLARRINRASA